ncbi:MAG: choice-of-anchor J domain-containing protein, partial [Bacteroidales bacterium]
FVAQIWGGDANILPSITNIEISPQSPTSSDGVTVSATITDADGAITQATLHWGLSSGNLSGTINMSNTTGDLYITDTEIPAQADGTSVYFTIEAEDDSAAINTSSILSYTINDGGATGLPFEEDFEALTAYATVDINGWSQYIEAGAETWEGREYEGNLYAQFSAYESGEASNVAWLFTPAIDLSGYSEINLSFKSKDGYNNGDPLEVLISDDYPGTGEPNGFSWVSLNPTLSTGNSSGYADNWTSSGDISLNDYTGNTVYIAFKYTGGDPSLTTTMQIDDVLITGVIHSNEPPAISNVQQTPETPTASDDVAVSSTITDADGTVTEATLHWGFSSGNLSRTIDMSNSTGEQYITDTEIPAQEEGTSVFFKVTATDNEDATTTTGEYSYEVSQASAVQHLEINQAKLFPNPASGIVHLVIPGYTGTLDFKLYDAIGTVVRTETRKYFNEKDRINLNGIVSGIYFMKISTEDGGTITRRLLINREF